MDNDLEIGQMLVAQGFLSQEQLARAVDKRTATNERLTKILYRDGFVDENVLLEINARMHRLAIVHLSFYEINRKVSNLLPESLVRKIYALPIGIVNKEFLVAMVDPDDLTVVDQISKRLKGSIRIVLVKESDFIATIDNLFERDKDISTLVGEVGEDVGEAVSTIDTADLQEDAPVNQLLGSLFANALSKGSSDIHIEPAKDHFKIRQRVDGMLQEQIMKDKAVLSALISRIKLMSRMNISEKRLPQDGSFTQEIKGRKIDVRVSTLPVQFGESMVMRILEQEGSRTSLRQTPMPDHVLHSILRNINQPNGLILFTGPTGSGKSTLLYAVLGELNSRERKIITVEDPVEYSLPGINQVQVLSKIGLTFATILRSVLRQDPNVIMIGEIRDNETAQIGLQAAMTGHLVLSTLHTNDSISAPERLIDIGVEPFLVAGALRLVVAQRLIRKICVACKEQHKLVQREQDWLDNNFTKEELIDLKLLQGKGCNSCNKTGYKGRVGVFEVLELDEKMLNALRLHDTAGFLQIVKSSKGFKPLKDSALALAKEGVTTLQEVFRVVGGVEY